MAKVKDFVKKVLDEITNAIGHRAEPEQADDSLEVLLRYESQWAFRLLQKTLEKHLESVETVSVESLQFLVDFLQTRHRLIKDTDAIYNHSGSSANMACIILAQHLVEELQLDGGKQHYYEYLFPGLRCADYKSSKGDLGALSLQEFFWSDDGIPVETLACLDAYKREIEKGVECYPPHVCLSEQLMKERPNAQLSVIETRRLQTHSIEAEKYMAAFDDCRQPQRITDVDACRSALIAKMSHDEFKPHYTYNQKPKQSNMNFLRNGFLKEIEIDDLLSFAHQLFNAVNREDWIDFVSAIDDDVFFQVVLPKVEEVQPAGTVVVTLDGRKLLEKLNKSRLPLTITEDALTGKVRMFLPDLCEVIHRSDGTISCLKPDKSILRTEKFKIFIDALAYSKDRDSDANKSVLFLLTELYLRNRHSHEGTYNGALGSWVGTPQEVKESAAGILREFFTKKSYHEKNNNPERQTKTYLINQITTYLKDTDNVIHTHALLHSRLGYITAKATSLGPGMRESAQSLGMLAEQFSRMPGGAWVEEMQLVPDNLLQSYVDSSGGFNKCIKAQEYRENNHLFNKAVLFILTEHYIRAREKGEEHKSFLGRYSWGKLEKVEAGKIFRAFLCSDKLPNRLTEYLQQEDKSKYESIIRDQLSLFSELGTLSAQAEAVCKPEFYQLQQGWMPSLKSMF